jgi:hypothetical protein
MVLTDTAAAYGIFQLVFGHLSDDLAVYTYHLRKRTEPWLEFEAVLDDSFGETLDQFKKQLKQFDEHTAEAECLSEIRATCDVISKVKDWRNRHIHARHRLTPDGYFLARRNGERLEMSYGDIEQQIQLAFKAIAELEAYVPKLIQKPKFIEEFDSLFDAPSEAGETGMAQVPILGELMYEIDSLYVSTEMIISHQFRKHPLDGLLLEASLLHFRVVWDFFHRRKRRSTDVVVRDFVPKWKMIGAPARLYTIRKWLNVKLAHLTTDRVDPACKAGEISEDDIRLIRTQTKALFQAFRDALTPDRRTALVNPLADKFGRYETLN